MWGFSRRKSTALGIDIGCSAVKVVQVRGDARTCSITACGWRPLPPGAVREKRIVDVGVVAAVLRELCVDLHCRGARAVTAVPSSAVITRQLQFPGTFNDAELELQVWLEAERQLPHAAEELALDFVSSATADGNTGVIVAACRKEQMETRCAVLARAGIAAIVVEPETQAVERIFALSGEVAGLHALADIGVTSLTLYVLRDGVLIHEREHVLAERLPLNGSDAEMSAVQERSLEELIAPLLRALQLFHSSGSPQRIARLVLAGRGALLPNLPQALEHRTGIPTAAAQTFAALRFCRQFDAAELERTAPLFVLALALALRGLRDD